MQQVRQQEQQRQQAWRRQQQEQRHRQAWQHQRLGQLGLQQRVLEQQLELEQGRVLLFCRKQREKEQQ